MVFFAFLLFVLLKLHLYKLFISSTSFFTSSIIFIANKLLEFQLRDGKTCAFDSIVIRSRNSSWQPTARIHRSSNGIFLVDLLLFMFYRPYAKLIALNSISYTAKHNKYGFSNLL